MTQQQTIDEPSNANVQLQILNKPDLKCFLSLWNFRNETQRLAELIRNKEDFAVDVMLQIMSISQAKHFRDEVFRLCAVLCCESIVYAKIFACAHKSAQFVARHLQNEAGFSLMCVAHILRYNGEIRHHVPAFIKRVVTVLERVSERIGPSISEICTLIKALGIFLRSNSLCREFCESSGPSLLLSIIACYCIHDLPAHAQLLYDTLFCCWLCLDYPSALPSLLAQNLITITHDALRLLEREKCVRISLFIVETLLHHQKNFFLKGKSVLLGPSSLNKGKGPNFAAKMNYIGLYQALKRLKEHTFEDSDITAKLSDVTHELALYLEKMNSFSQYLSELRTGFLAWNPAHLDETFWIRNMLKLEANRNETLSTLQDLIASSQDEQTLAVACHDVGEIVRHHPEGRRILEYGKLLDLKNTILQLVSHPSPEVSRNALIAIQKIIVQKRDHSGIMPPSLHILNQSLR